MKLFRPKLATTYGEQTYASPYWIVRYPHQVRLRTAVKAVLANNPDVLLDYGAGDGNVLFGAIAGGFTGRIVAYEPDDYYKQQISSEADQRGLASRIKVIGDRADLRGPFDLVTCLGVLEHMPLREREAFCDMCRAQLATAGRVLIDVPIEIGPTLLVKNTARLLLKGHDKQYNWRDLLRLSAGATMYDPSRYDPSDTRTWIQNHVGFDYRLLEQELCDGGFQILDRQSTPIGWLPAPFLNQERLLTVSL